jgi:hypothetical protein
MNLRSGWIGSLYVLVQPYPPFTELMHACPKDAVQV